MATKPGGLLGREQEFAAVDRFLAAVEAGSAALVFEGEAGIGKTALFDRAIDEARARGYRVLLAQPTSAESRLSFVGLTDLLSGVHHVFTELPAPQRRALEVALLLDDSEDAVPDPRAIGMGLLGVLRAVLVSGPVVVAADDLQWLDPASAAALSFALRRATDERVGLLGVLRRGTSAAADLGGGDRVPVGPLSVGAIYALLAERLELSIPRSVLLRVHEASRGNPLFALEIGRALKERGLPQPGEPFEIPTDTETLFASRVERLPAATLDALAIAAAITAPTPALVKAVSAGPLEPAIEADIVRIDGRRIHFTHPLLAAAVYARLDSDERRALHRRIAGGVRDPEERARHLALAADTPEPAIAAALDQATKQAARRGAPAAAAELAELAVKLTPQHETELHRRRRHAAARYHLLAGDVLRAHTLLQELVRELPAGVERARSLHLLADTYGESTRALSLREQAVAEAAGNDHVLAEALCELAFTFFIGADPGRALVRAREAVKAARRTDDPRLLASSIVFVAGLECLEGRMTPGLLEEALALEERGGYVGDYRSPTMIDGLRLMWLEDDLDAARARLAQAEQVARDHGDDSARMRLLYHRAALECRAGRFDDAARYASELDSLHRQFDPTAESTNSQLALAEALRGRTEAAQATAEHALADAERGGHQVAAVENQWVLGFLALSTSEMTEAAEILEPLCDRVPGRAWGRPTAAPIVADAVEALIAVGELEQARARLGALDEAAQLGIAYAGARAARCHGLLAAARRDYVSAFESFDEALVAHERLPDPLERGRTLLALGQTQRRAGHRRDARETLERARAIFDELGAPLWSAQAQRELGRLGGRTPSDDALTGAEERVARLVAEGKTNREVASALFVTTRTVEAHLSSIYRKLDLRSRTELAGFIAGHRSS